MFKIKLLILLLLNFILTSCVSNNQLNDKKLSVSYIGGEYDGLLLSNTLTSYLNSLNMLDRDSNYEIKASISHSNSLFVTNIDKTSDRERITSVINIKIFDKEKNCFTYSFKNDVSQFYILAPSDKFMSNKRALEEIKLESTEYLTKKFINDLSEDSFACN